MNTFSTRALAAMFVVVLFSSCAKELTQEERSREEAIRTYSRLEKAQGTYQGYVEIGEGTIPLSLSLTVLGNPTSGDKKPELRSSMRLGLFGGVNLNSRGAAFDWGTSEITLSFGRSAGAAAGAGSAVANTTGGLELTGIVDGESIQNALLTGSRQGVHKVTLARVEKAVPVLDQESFYSVFHNVHDGETAPHALLSLKKAPLDMVSPEGADMPLWPGLDVSMRFPYLAQTPQTASEVLYDPLAATVTLNFTAESRVEIGSVYTRKEDPVGTIPRNLVGKLSQSGIQQNTLNFAAAPVNARPSMPLLPPRTYRGTFDTGDGTPAYRAVVYLNPTGSTFANGPDYPFRSFPELRLTLYICDGNTDAGKKELRTTTLHPLDRKIFFTSSATGFKKDLELDFNADWSELNGVFVSHKSSSTGEPQVKLKSDPKLGTNGCKE